MEAAAIICDAIGRKRRISFRYKDSDRLVEPYILGFDAAGTLVLSAVQLSGGSGAGFRSFEVGAIALLTVSTVHFSGSHPQYNPRDRMFARVLCQV